jgi:hypothetical protein
MMPQILEVEVVVRIITPDRTMRPLYVAVNGAGDARAVMGAMDVAFKLSPPPVGDENIWVLMARIASEGARAEAKKFL